MSSSSASQNDGVLASSRQAPRISRSGQRARQTPAVTPSASPSTPANSQAKTSTPREAASRSPITSTTGWR